MPELPNDAKPFILDAVFRVNLKTSGPKGFIGSVSITRRQPDESPPERGEFLEREGNWRTDARVDLFALALLIMRRKGTWIVGGDGAADDDERCVARDVAEAFAPTGMRRLPRRGGGSEKKRAKRWAGCIMPVNPEGKSPADRLPAEAIFRVGRTSSPTFELSPPYELGIVRFVDHDDADVTDEAEVRVRGWIPRERRPRLSKDAGQRLASRRTLVESSERQLLNLVRLFLRLRNGRWFRVMRGDPTSPDFAAADFGAQIGVFQEWKVRQQYLLRSAPVPNDESYLLESTAAIIGRGIEQYPEVEEACETIVLMLEALRRIRSFHSEKEGLPFSAAYYMQRWVWRVVAHKDCYLFLLYLTYLRVETSRAPRVLALLREFPLLHRLSNYEPGINVCFYKYHGHELFALRGDRFTNLYYEKTTVRAGDTLEGIANEAFHPTEVAEGMRAMAIHNPSLRGRESRPLDALNDLVGSQVVAVPPHQGRLAYEERMRIAARYFRSRGVGPADATNPF